MEEAEYKELLLELISNLKAKPEYLKSIKKDDSFNQDYFDGMALAYHLVLDEIITTIQNSNINLNEFDLQKYNSLDILKIKPIQ